MIESVLTFTFLLRKVEDAQKHAAEERRKRDEER